MTNRPKPDVSAGLWDFAQGYAHLKTGQRRLRGSILARVKKTAETSKAVFRVHTAEDLLGVAGGILEGEILRTAATSTARSRRSSARPSRKTLVYDEPEPLPFSARHWLARRCSRRSGSADAERTYRDELKDHPHNGWSLLGLQQALAAQGKPTDDVDADLAASLARSDTLIVMSQILTGTCFDLTILTIYLIVVIYNCPCSPRRATSPSPSPMRRGPSPPARTSLRRRCRRRGTCRPWWLEPDT